MKVDASAELGELLSQHRNQWNPSWQLSLSGLVIASCGIAGYSVYKLYFAKDELFIPLWITGTHRKPYACEVNKDELIEVTIDRLKKRLLVDEVVTNLLGGGVAIDLDSPDTKCKVYVRTKTPGIAGIAVNPRNWHWGISWRGFSRADKSANKEEPMVSELAATSEAADDDMDTEVVDMLPPSIETVREVVVDGQVSLKSTRLSNNSVVKTAIVKYVATRNLDLPGDAPAFANSAIFYEHDGQMKTQRLH